MGEEELLRERLSFLEHHGDCQSEASAYCVKSASGSFLGVSSERSSCMDARGARGLKPGARSFGIVVERKEGDRSESLRQGDRARGNRSREESRKKKGLFFREGEAKRRPGELLSAV